MSTSLSSSLSLADNIKSYVFLANSDEKAAFNITNTIDDLRAKEGSDVDIKSYEQMLDDTSPKDTITLANYLAKYVFNTESKQHISTITSVIKQYLSSNCYESIHDLSDDDCDLLADKLEYS